MVKLRDLLSATSQQIAKEAVLCAGSVWLGPMLEVDHEKFYIIAGISGDKVCVCSVIINSAINQFILKRPHLLERQCELSSNNYSFLSHTSYVNCAQPLKGKSKHFMSSDFRYVGNLTEEDLEIVRCEIVKSGMLTEEEIKLFQL